MILLAALAIAPFVPSLRSQLVWDDHEFIANNPTIKNLFPLNRFFQTQGLIEQGAIHPVTASRPLTSLSLALDYAVWRLNPFGYHLTNIFLHLLCVLAVYYLLRGSGGDFYCAWFGAGFFAVLPGHAEAVIALIGRSDLLAAFFLITGFMAYVRFTTVRSHAAWWYAAALFCGLAACLSKETGVILFAIILVWEVFVRRRLRRAWPRIVPFVLIVLGYLVYRGAVLQGNTAGSGWWGGNASRNFLMMPMIFVRYLRVLFLPWSLSPLHLVRIPERITDTSFLAGFLLLAAAFGWSIFCLIRKPWIGFNAAWYLLALAPVSNVIPIPGIYMAERWLYLPSAGLCGLAGYFLSRWIKEKAWLAALIFGVAATGFAVRSFIWNRVWHDEDALSRQIVRTSPASHLGQTMRGRVLLDQGKLAEAEEHLQTAVRLRSGYYLAHSTLGTVYANQGRYEEAERAYRTAIRLNPRYAEAHSNLAVIRSLAGQTGEAIRELQIAVNLDPENYIFHFNLAQLFYDEGRQTEALTSFQKAARLAPDRIEAQIMIGIVLAEIGELAAAETQLRSIVEQGAAPPVVHYNLGLVYDRQGRTAAAIAEYRVFLGSNPDSELMRAVEDRIRVLQEQAKQP